MEARNVQRSLRTKAALNSFVEEENMVRTSNSFSFSLIVLNALWARHAFFKFFFNLKVDIIVLCF